LTVRSSRYRYCRQHGEGARAVRQRCRVPTGGAAVATTAVQRRRGKTTEVTMTATRAVELGGAKAALAR